MNNTAITNNVLVKKSKMKKDKVIFLITAMTLPLIQFFIMYIMVNFNSILLSFKTYNGDGTFTFSGFNQFGQVIKDFANESFMSKMLTNSLIMYLVTSPLTLVSCMFLAYTIWKKVLFNKFFSVILFLPSILPSMVFVILGNFVFKNLVPAITGVPAHSEMLNPPQGFTTLLWYQFFVSFGPNTIYFLGSMSNISPSVVEAGKLDGANTLREFIHIVFPSVFPTLTSLVVVGFISIFNNQGYILAFYGVQANDSVKTFGYYIYTRVKNAVNYYDYPYTAAMGMLFTVIAIPVVLAIRHFMEKFGPSED